LRRWEQGKASALRASGPFLLSRSIRLHLGQDALDDSDRGSRPASKGIEMKKATRIFPTRSGKLVDCNLTTRDEFGLHGYEPTLDRRTGQYVAVRIFIPC